MIQINLSRKKKRNRLTDIENRLVVVKRGERWINGLRVWDYQIQAII